MTDAVLPIAPCCFCGRSDYAPPDPTFLMIGTRDEVTRTWWCHVACFDARVADLPAPWSSYDRAAEREG